MNSLSEIHFDVLLIMAEDTTKRAAAGELLPSQYAMEIEPINTEMLKRLREMHLELMQHMAELENRHKREPWELDMQDMELLIADYEQFLKLKGLDQEFDKWIYEQIKQCEQ